MRTSRERSNRSDYKCFKTIPTRLMDNDFQGHMNNVIYYSLIDTAVCGWLIDNGIFNFQGDGPRAVAAETGCRFFSNLAYPDVVTAGLRVTKIGSTSVQYRVGLFRNEESAVSAEGFMVHVYVDPDNRRPVPLGEKLKKVLMTIYGG